MKTILILPVTILSLLLCPIAAVYLSECVKWVRVGLWLFVDGD